jgi:hypothetical protein
VSPLEELIGEIIPPVNCREFESCPIMVSGIKNEMKVTTRKDVFSILCSFL